MARWTSSMRRKCLGKFCPNTKLYWALISVQKNIQKWNLANVTRKRCLISFAGYSRCRTIRFATQSSTSSFWHCHWPLNATMCLSTYVRLCSAYNWLIQNLQIKLYDDIAGTVATELRYCEKSSVVGFVYWKASSCSRRVSSRLGRVQLQWQRPWIDASPLTSPHSCYFPHNQST